MADARRPAGPLRRRRHGGPGRLGSVVRARVRLRELFDFDVAPDEHRQRLAERDQAPVAVEHRARVGALRPGFVPLVVRREAQPRRAAREPAVRGVGQRDRRWGVVAALGADAEAATERSGAPGVGTSASGVARGAVEA